MHHGLRGGWTPLFAHPIFLTCLRLWFRACCWFYLCITVVWFILVFRPIHFNWLLALLFRFSQYRPAAAAIIQCNKLLFSVMILHRASWSTCRWLFLYLLLLLALEQTPASIATNIWPILRAHSNLALCHLSTALSLQTENTYCYLANPILIHRLPRLDSKHHPP